MACLFIVLKTQSHTQTHTKNKMSSSSSSPSSKLHFVLFPFMSKGHTIPLLHLTTLLLLRREISVTILTTPVNLPFISSSLSGTRASITALPFPDNIAGIPPGIESTDKLPSMSLFIPFVESTKLMKPYFEEAIQSIDPSCIISDGFLHWTLESAQKFNIPRLSFYGMSYYATALNHDAMSDGFLWSHDSSDEQFTMPSFPWIKLTRNDWDEPFNKRDPAGPHWDFVIQSVTATANSYGMIMNSFYELETLFVDYCKNTKPKTWCVGPLCLAELLKMDIPSDKKWIDFLDKKLAQKCPVLYIAFGSQAKLSSSQLIEIARGLEESNVSFLWVVRDKELIDGFEERVKERGIVVSDWVDQKEILEHESVKGFLSHCGWNSVLESICAEVPILAWPLMADQGLNAKMVEEEIKIGLRVKSVDGTAKGFVSRESLMDSVVELMEGEKGKEAREKVKGVAAAARGAVAEGGSSWRGLEELIGEIKGLHEKKWRLSE